MKKFISLIINLALILCIVSNGMVYANTENVDSSAQMKIGDYFTLGKYNDKPIVWRCAADDENGKLMVSDKILCCKNFGAYYSDQGTYESIAIWKESYIRKWLNSDVSSDDADWSASISKYDVERYDMDINEKGFLNDDNFSVAEKDVLKLVTQWTMLPKPRLNLSENGIDAVYDPVKLYVPGNPRDGGITEFYNISELPEHYYGAAQQTADTIFLLDEMQLYNMWENLDNVASEWNKEFDNTSYYPLFDYFLRTTTSNSGTEIHGSLYAYDSYNGPTYYYSISDRGGVRPAFYLNEDNATILSGTGTEEEPYVINGKIEDSVDNNTADATEEKPSGISVFYNGSEISFDQSPFIENDRVLVPMRAIFEALGAEVKWNEVDQRITATCGEDVIKMQIGNLEMVKNDSTIQSEVAPQIIAERTFIPLRVISENLSADVQWIGDEQKVVITK